MKAAAWTRSLGEATLGIGCMVAGGLLLTVNDGIAKWMAAGFPVGEVMFVRGLVTVTLISLYIWHTGRRALVRVRAWPAQLVRAGLTVYGTFMFVASLRYLPLAEAIAITFAGPLFITALAGPMIGERVGWRRWAAVTTGFLGVVVMFRPGTAAMTWAALMPLSAALTGAVRDLITRRIAQTESSLSILLVTTAGVTLGGLGTAPFGWKPLAAEQVGLLMTAGVFLGSAHFLMIEAFRRAEATLVAPFKYATVVWAMLAGAVVWGDRPDAWMTAGLVLVVGSGLYIFHREAAIRPRAAGH